MLTAAELQDAKKALQDRIIYEEKKLGALQKAKIQEKKLLKKINPEKLIAVHLTNYFPSQGRIKTTGQNNLIIGGKEVYCPRETIHLTLNGAVGSHMAGNWDGCKYAVLIPLHLIWDRIYSLAPEDTYVFGELILPKGSEVMGRKQDLNNGNCGLAEPIFVDEGESIHEAVRRRVLEKKYLPVRITDWSWDFDVEQIRTETYNQIGGGEDLLDPVKLNQLIFDAGKKRIQHEGSLLHDIEQRIIELYKWLYEGKQIKKNLENFEEDCQKLLVGIDKLIDERKKVRSEAEINSLQRIRHIVELLPHEYSLFELKQGKSIYGFEKLEDLDKEEEKWLLREYSVLKKLEKSVESHDSKKTKKMFRKIARVERKVYPTYKRIMANISELEQDNSFPIDISDVKQRMNFFEGNLAKHLSINSTELRYLVEQGKWQKK